ncbi:MAG: hypothetical protein AAB553_04180 [Patescibacteria group bacterium]
MLLLLFLLGAYLFGAGEGWHEVASFTFNTYCDIDRITTNLCGGLFINDYYAGNIIFFVGTVMMNTAIMLLSLRLPAKKFTKNQLAILFANSFIFGFMWYAYAAFDPVHVGFFFATLLMVISLGIFFKIRENWRSYPYIMYSVTGYTLASIATLLVRFI